MTARLPEVQAAADTVAYGEIERELRARYLIAYESTHVNPGGDFRKVDLALARPGLVARTIRGYYP